MKNKRYMVVPRTPEAQEKGVDTGKGHLDFGKRSALWVEDHVVATDIDQKSGLKGRGDVWVHEDPMYEWHLDNEGSSMDGRNHDVHNYTFGPTASYSRAWEEFEKRRKDKRNGKEKAERLQGSTSRDSQKTRNKQGAGGRNSGKSNQEGQPCCQEAQPAT